MSDSISMSDLRGSDTPTVEPTATVQETAGTDAPTTNPTTDAWNGEVEHLEKRPWWTKLSPEEQEDLRSGYKMKATNLETGFNKKFQSVAEERKAWQAEKAKYDADLKSLREEASFVREVFGNGSPEASDAEAKLKALREEYEAKLNPLNEELTSLREFKSKAEQAEQARMEKLISAEEKRMEESYKDILSNAQAADLFSKLIGAEIEEDVAAEMARQKFGITKPRLPAAAAYSSRGDSPAVQERLPKGLKPKDLIERAVEMAARQHGLDR